VDRELSVGGDPGAEIGMEACGAHHWARVLQGKGYRVEADRPEFW